MTDDFENRVRDMLRQQSAQAPDDYPVVQQVLRDVAARPSTAARRAPFRSWLIPLVAAGAVAAVAATVVGLDNFRPSAHHGITPGTDGPTGSFSVLPTQTQQSTPAPSSPPASATHAVVPNPLGLTNFRVVDLTWVGDDGWALGSADCLKGGGTCTAVARTTNGGKTWVGAPTPPAAIAPLGAGCASSAGCVSAVRFATDQDGYAFGTGGFFTTTDAGKHWKSQTLSPNTVVLALETLDGNVIRVTSECVPGCPVTVQTAAIGSNSWTTRNLPGGQPGMQSGVTLVRVQGAAYLAVYGHVAGGAQNATSDLFVSTDDGVSWTDRGEPCPQTGGGAAGSEVDSTAIASGGGTLAALCTPRGGSVSHVITSANHGATFTTGAGELPGAGAPLAVSGRVILVDCPSGLVRSTDGGATWNPVVLPGLAGARWLGFESLTDARVVSGDGSTVWTTHDAGAHWTPTTFP